MMCQRLKREIGVTAGGAERLVELKPGDVVVGWRSLPIRLSFVFL